MDRDFPDPDAPDQEPTTESKPKKQLTPEITMKGPGKIRITIKPEDVIRGKFSATIAKIEGYLQEARGTDDNYYPSAVKSRMENLKKVMELEIQKLAESIELIN